MAVSDLAQSCADLAAWLHPARELIVRPDIRPVPGRPAPGSKPPWNAEAANLLFAIHAGLRDIEQQFRYDVTGRPAHLCRRQGTWTDQRTVRVLQAITRLSDAAEPGHVAEAARQISGWVASAMQLPAVDLEEKWRALPSPCPRCRRRMLRACVRNGKVACLGCVRRGRIMPGTVSDGYVEWEDGTIT
jgi:hypothetical protein